MDYKEFRQLLEQKGTDGKNPVADLEDIISRYPYFQAARLLLAKALHDRQDIHYEEAMKLAAVYSTDRNVLRKLLQEVSVAETESEKAGKRESEIITSPHSQLHTPDYSEWYSEEEISGEAFDEREEKPVDRHRIVRERLSEILKPVAAPPSEEGSSGTQDTNVALEEVPPIKQESEETPVPPSADTGAEAIITEEAAKAADVLDKMAIEYAMEESILASLEKLPIITPRPSEGEIPGNQIPASVEQEKATIDEHEGINSFTGWLKKLSPKPFSNFEQVNLEESLSSDGAVSEEYAELPPLGGGGAEDIIDKFIATEPKIIPSKTEFYSPVSQAKKGLIEHDDMATETLARIYEQQGNLAKAKWCYEKLMLLYPEKSSYFAPLLKEIEHKIINENH